MPKKQTSGKSSPKSSVSASVQKAAASKKSASAQHQSAFTQKVFSQTVLLIFAGLVGLNHFLICQLSYFVDVTAWQNTELYLCAALAFYAMVYFFVNHVRFHMKAAYLIPAAMMIWYFISCLAMNETYKANWLEYNRKPLIDTLITLLVCFPMGAALAKENDTVHKVLNIVIHALILAWTVFIVYILIHVFQLELIYLPNGGQIGMNRQAALCLNCHYNTTGAWQTLFFLGSLCMAIRSRNIFVKVLDFIAALIHFIPLVLSNSRTSFIAAAAGFVGMVFVAVYHGLSPANGHKPLSRKILHYLIPACIAIVAGALFLVLRSYVYQLFQSVTHFNELVLGNDDSAMVRKVIDSTTSTLTGRTYIWIGALKGMVSTVQRFFLGVTPPGVNSLISLMTDGKFNVYTHNEILEIGVAIGVPAMIAFIVWFFIILKSGYTLVRRDTSREWGPIVLILALMLGNMAEATLLFYQYITGMVFFFVCGWVYVKALEKQKASPRKK